MPTYEDIKKKIAGLEKQAEELRRKELSAVIEEIREKMAQFDLSVEDIAPRRRGRPRRSARPGTRTSTAKPMYRHPETGGTWTGRGRKPTWLVEALEEGRSLEEFRI